MKKIIIYGLGQQFKVIEKYLDEEYTICGYSDRNIELADKCESFIAPENLVGEMSRLDFVVVTPEFIGEDIKRELATKYNIPLKKIKLAHEVLDIKQIQIDRLKLEIINQKTILEELSAECNIKRKAILNLQKRLRKYENFNEWENIEHFMDHWSNRSYEMSKYIRKDAKSLLDLGCGEMHIQKFIDTDVKYYGCDYKKRCDDTIVCDLSRGEFPNIYVDTIFIAGVLEYLANWEEIINYASKHCRQLLLSYVTHEISPVRDKVWVTDLNENEIVEYAKSCGFILEEKEFVDNKKNVMFSFVIE